MEDSDQLLERVWDKSERSTRSGTACSCEGSGINDSQQSDWLAGMLNVL